MAKISLDSHLEAYCGLTLGHHERGIEIWQLISIVGMFISIFWLSILNRDLGLVFTSLEVYFIKLI